MRMHDITKTHVLLALFAGLLFAAHGPNVQAAEYEAEKLFRNMEEKVTKAKTLELVFDGKMDIQDGGQRMVMPREGSLLLAEGNRMRLELKEGTTPATMWRLMISDGARMKLLDQGSYPQIQPAPQSGNSEMLSWVSRAGVLLPQMPLPDVKATSGKDRYAVSAFRLGDKEKIGDRQAQQLEYQMVVKGHPGQFNVTVWLDSDTHLPVKRVVTSQMQGNTATVSERYTKLTLNGKVESGKFELAK